MNLHSTYVYGRFILRIITGTIMYITAGILTANKVGVIILVRPMRTLVKKGA